MAAAFAEGHAQGPVVARGHKQRPVDAVGKGERARFHRYRAVKAHLPRRDGGGALKGGEVCVEGGVGRVGVRAIGGDFPGPGKAGVAHGQLYRLFPVRVARGHHVQADKVGNALAPRRGGEEYAKRQRQKRAEKAAKQAEALHFIG